MNRCSWPAEVIGTVLVSHQQLLDAHQDGLIKNTVAQAAPVLANLRNLALAEFRANSDSPTGLPNKRATDGTLKRMVAQANRSITPRAAAILDFERPSLTPRRFPFPKGHACPYAPRAQIACEHLPNDTRNRSVQTLDAQPAMQISVSCSHPWAPPLRTACDGLSWVRQERGGVSMSPLSRRSFLSTTAVAAGAVAVVGPRTQAATAAAPHDAAETGWWGAESVASEPFVVYIRDAHKGEVAVLSGEHEIVYVDRVLVGRLQRAVRRAGK